jgi:hypothetical protein
MGWKCSIFSATTGSGIPTDPVSHDLSDPAVPWRSPWWTIRSCEQDTSLAISLLISSQTIYV